MIKPYNTYVVLSAPEEGGEQDVQRSGIIVLNQHAPKVVQGKVLAVAEDTTAQVSVGDTVLYHRVMGNEVELGNETYILLKSTEILGSV